MQDKLTRLQVNSWRLSRHHLDKRLPGRELAQAVSDVCGLQCQVLSAGQIGICARVEDVSAKDVEAALWEKRTLVKTWCMRGTLHLLAASDLPLYVAALKTRIGYMNQSWLKFHKIGLTEIEKITREARNSLNDHRLTRQELVNDIVKRAELGEWAKREMLSGWGSLLHPAAYKGNLCFGPSKGKNVTFVRPDQWLREWKEPSSQEALKTLARRFVAAYGPSTHEDFGHWWGAAGTGGNPANTPREIFGLISDELVQVDFEGRKAWLREPDLEQVKSSRPSRSVRLLPSFDCYIMMYRPREFPVEARLRDRVFRQLAGWVSPVLLIDGVAAGTWQYKKRTSGLQVTVEPFRALTSSEKHLVTEEGRRLGEFFETNAKTVLA